MAGCDAVLHAAAVFSLDPRAAARVRETNVRAAEIVLGAAVRMGLDPIVHVSSYVALLPPEPPGAVLTPDSPVTRPGGTYSRSKAESEQVARRYQEQGAPVVIVYPGGVIGPDDPYLGDSNRSIVEFAKSGLRHARRGPDSRCQGCGGGARRGHGARPGPPPLHDHRALRRLAGPHRDAAADHRPPQPDRGYARWHDPGRRPRGRPHATPGARPAPLQPRGHMDLPLQPHCDDSRTISELGITPRDLRVTLTDTVQWLADQGHLRRPGKQIADQGPNPAPIPNPCTSSVRARRSDA